MIISILNCDINWGIGKKNGLLFSLPKDMKFFRETTLNHVVCMGENTLLSFPNSKPLKNRTHIVLSKDPTHNYEGVINVHTFEEFLNKINEFSKCEDVYVIGGASIYNQTLPYVDKVLLTKVHADGKAEVFFTNLDENNDFVLSESSEVIQDGDYEIQFLTYVNVKKKGIK
ncbi:MAG: dihydrofolate reductase [Erysipelotrichales bacterium]|nr:dihydrofolate reductase [Erysipelotrichales bacterium]